MTLQDYERAWQYAEQRLERELPSGLLYHGVFHTRDEVVPAAKRLAGMEGLPDDMLPLLLTAAWFHDIGYVEQTQYHELISVRIATQMLPTFGYSEDQVETIRWAILATILPQSPTTLLEQILTDADLDSLGTANFMRRSNDLRNELALLGNEVTDIEWYNGQLKFVGEHQYFTASARALRDAQKLSNLAEVRKVLSELKQ